MVLLEYRNVSKSFGKAQVLRDINLKIPSGKIIGLLGKNGTGKSTLIKLANDLLTPNFKSPTCQNALTWIKPWTYSKH